MLDKNDVRISNLDQAQEWLEYSNWNASTESKYSMANVHD